MHRLAAITYTVSTIQDLKYEYSGDTVTHRRRCDGPESGGSVLVLQVQDWKHSSAFHCMTRSPASQRNRHPMCTLRPQMAHCFNPKQASFALESLRWPLNLFSHCTLRLSHWVCLNMSSLGIRSLSGHGALGQGVNPPLLLH